MSTVTATPSPEEATMATATIEHRILRIEPKPATGPGALDGFLAVCTCGPAASSSLESLARQWGREHADYMNRREARQ